MEHKTRTAKQQMNLFKSVYTIFHFFPVSLVFNLNSNTFGTIQYTWENMNQVYFLNYAKIQGVHRSHAKLTPPQKKSPSNLEAAETEELPAASGNLRSRKYKKTSALHSLGE